MTRPLSYTMQFYRQYIGDGNYPPMPAVGDFAAIKAQLSDALLARACDEKIEARLRPNKAVLLDHHQATVAHIEVTHNGSGFTTQDIP